MSEIKDLSKLCVHTITTKPWGIEEAAKNFSAAGVKGITVWRDALDGRNSKQTGNMLREHDLSVVSLCRGGFHLWWDPFLEKEIKRCGENGNLMAFHICDWKLLKRIKNILKK